MQDNYTPDPSNLINRLNKVTDPPTQLQTIFRYLQEYTATASMISFETGVPRRSICRYKRDLEKAGLLLEIEKEVCAVTGYKAWYLTTDLRPTPNYPRG